MAGQNDMSMAQHIERMIPLFNRMKWKMAAIGIGVGLVSGLLVVLYRLGIEHCTRFARWMYAQIRVRWWSAC